MAAGALNDALDVMAGRVADAGVRVFVDPSSISPPGVLIEPPTLTARSRSVVELRFPLVCLALPPSNLAALRTLLELADAVTEYVDNVTDGQPTVWGDKDLPAYQMTATLTIQR